MKTVASLRGYIISTTYALRSRVYVTEDDSNGLEWTNVGHILVTVKGVPHPHRHLVVIGISTPHSGGSFNRQTDLPTEIDTKLSF